MADQQKSTNSSMIDLKAELFRKQEEYKQLKAHNSSDFLRGVKTNKPAGKGEKIWSKKNAGVLQRASRDLAQKEEEDNVMDRSRRALEAKSKIYDKIASASGIPDEDGSEGFLVDFQRKAVDRIVEQRREEGRTGGATVAGKGCVGSANSDAAKDDLPDDEPLPLPANSEEEWVDYVDTFGRSRRCMKKDLPHLENQERPLGRPPGEGVGLKLKEGATLLSADMKRELRRQQWEKEAEESANGPVHYANVQYDEIRSHGTGFYQFSKDSNLREEQMEMLNKLREQTMDGRQRSERIKEKRKVALEARLAKVKQRRKMKEGSVLGLDDKEEDEEKEKQTPAKDSPPPAAAKETEPLTRDDSWRRSAPVREWDIGKEKLPEWNAKRYMEQKRSERENEFAPPQFYFDQPSERKHGAARRDINSQNGAGHGQGTRLPSSAVSNTDAMLKQIRHSVGPLPHTHTGVHEDTKPSLAGEEGRCLQAEEADDIGSIPLPQTGAEAEHSSLSVKREGQQEAGVSVEDHRTGETVVGPLAGWESLGTCWVQNPALSHATGPSQQFSSPLLPDVSLPPPGYQSESWGKQAEVLPTPQPVLPSVTITASLPGEQEHCLPSPFVYPSQQGLLSSKPSPQTASITQRPVPNPAPTKAWASKPAVSKVTASKVSMVDKRFMQNREVSDEDLLGYMAHVSADPLTKIQAVSYTPGHFSSVASSQSHASSVLESNSSIGKETEAASDAKPAAQTEGVIFGVPDFLQPAAMTATSYQPGSFMAAKEAAAQRAEEQYEVARKKKQYSSAPVLYGRPEDNQPPEQGGDGDSETEKKEQSLTAPHGDETDEEFAKFMKAVAGKK